MTTPLKQISDSLTEQTDIFVDGVDVIVTSAPEVDGNEVTLRVHGSDGDVMLGFDDGDSFASFVERLISGGDLEVEK